MVSRAWRRQAVARLREEGISERHACMLLGVSRGAMRGERKEEEQGLRETIRRLAAEHPRYGYRRIRVLLGREGMVVNRKRVERIWREEGLGLRGKRPRRRLRGPRGEMKRKAEFINEVWSYDFVEDRTERGGRLRILAVVDEYSRECLLLRVEKNMNGAMVVESLRRLFRWRGRPAYLRSDNGPEFVCAAVQKWLAQSGCGTLYITPGSPWENAYVESFNGKLRDECLNREVFRHGKEAQIILEEWRQEYNYERPHSALGYLTPAQFAASASSGRATPSLRLPTLPQPAILSL